MKHSIAPWLTALLLGLALLTPQAVFADTEAEYPMCDKEKEKDKINLCRAFNPKQSDNKNRYQNKNHSNYYCSLIKNRDLQTYCYAVVGNNKVQCGLIVDADVEKECNSKF